MYQPEAEQANTTPTSTEIPAQLPQQQSSDPGRNQAQVAATLRTDARWQPRTVPATSLSGAQRPSSGNGLQTVAAEFGYSGPGGDVSAMRAHALELMGYDSGDLEGEAWLDGEIQKRETPENLYQPVTASSSQQDKLRRLRMPDKLSHDELKQSAQGGACQGVAAIAGLLLGNPARLRSLLVDGDAPDHATFKFPAANALTPYIAHSAPEVQATIALIQRAQAQQYQVKKQLHEGDLLPTTEPWANLLLKATHQHITECGIANLDGYNALVPLDVKRTADGPTESITFNLVSGEIGRSSSGAAFPPKSDDELRGKTLQIGHRGHATVLVGGTDGKKTYYDNQSGQVDVTGTVHDFLSGRGMLGNNTSIVVEGS